MKYPIILVHGLAIKNYKFIKSFGNIERILNENNFKTYTSNQDGFGSIENNANQLKEEINKIIEKEQCEKVNIIAHSKGGLDIKYMIEELNMVDKIASFTTLCTPFKGSIIASLLLKLPNIIKKPLAFILNFWYKIFKDKNPDALKACEQLKKVEKLEKETLKVPNTIYCQSYYTELKKTKDDFIMGIPLQFSIYFENETTDGLVSEESSKFGDFKGIAINDSISHRDIVDFYPRKNKKEKIYNFYIELCKDLEELGF
jgi:triacylglycerol lipase